MASKLSAGSLRRGDHACSWYGTDRDHASIVEPFLADGLDAGERVLFLRADSSAEHVAEMAGAGAADAMQEGRLQVRDAGDMYAPGGAFDATAMLGRLQDAATEARDAGYAGLRIAAEMSWAIQAEGGGAAELDDYERRSNEVFDRNPLTAICLYDRRRFPPGAPSPGGAHGLHVWPDAPSPYAVSIRITEMHDPYGIALEGEADFVTSAALAEALTRLVDVAAGDVHVDLSGLRFIDAGGARLLARAARQLSPARTLVLDAPTRPVRRLLEVLDGRLTGGFVVEEGVAP